MKFKAINRTTKQSEYVIEANNIAQARLFMVDIDPGNEKYLVVEESKYRAAKVIDAERKGFLKDLEQRQKACTS